MGSARIIRHAVVDSTNERALATIAAGTASHLDVHVAHAQSAGRGRMGRGWSSPPGEGLYASLVWMPVEPTPNPALLTMAAGLAVLDSLLEIGLEGACLRWPNDVLLAGAKLCGILVEARGLDPARPSYVVGVGVNVRQRRFESELASARAVTSLALAGLDTSPERVLDAFVPNLVARLEATSVRGPAIATEYARVLGLLGCEVLARSSREELRGRLVGLSLERGVELILEDGAPIARPLEHVLALGALGRGSAGAFSA